MTNNACWGGGVFQIIKKIQICTFKLFKNLKYYKCDAIPVLQMIYNMYNVWYSTQPTGYKTTVNGVDICSFVSGKFNKHVHHSAGGKQKERESKRGKRKRKF